MLKTKIISLVLVALILIGVPVLASAAILDPYEGGSVTVDGNLEVVSIRLDTSKMFWQRFHDGAASVNGSGSALSYSTQMRYVDNDTVSCWPFGATTYILTGGIPTGSNISVDMAIGLNIANQSQNFECVAYLYLDTYDSLGNSINRVTVWSETQNPVVGSTVFFVDPVIDTALIQGSWQWSLTFSFDFNGVSNENDTTSVTLQCFGDNISLDVPYSQVYQLQQQGEKTNQLLDQIDKQMSANGEKLDDVIKQGQINAGKLDDVNQNLDDVNQNLEQLPGQIGDQMQGIIDAENNKAESDGNKFVDQILSALPDPSTKVLASFKTLTDATSYTGTDAKMPIPALVVPKVGDLIPETTLWGGTEFDFGEYMQVVPDNILVLVQSLFTIAIVLYCVYELIGLIRYCLTLRGGE